MTYYADRDLTDDEYERLPVCKNCGDIIRTHGQFCCKACKAEYELRQAIILEAVAHEKVTNNPKK